MLSLSHTIHGVHHDGVYTLSLMRDEEVIQTFRTTSAPTFGAAAYLLELNEHPEVLALEWRGALTLDPSAPVDLDSLPPDQLGRNLAQAAEVMQQQKMSSPEPT